MPQCLRRLQADLFKDYEIPGCQVCEPVQVGPRNDRRPRVSADRSFVKHDDRQAVTGDLNRSGQDALGNDAFRGVLLKL